MLRHAWIAVASLGLGAVVLTACGSVPDLHFDDGDASASQDGGGEGGEGGPTGPCVPTGAEICDDGIDNDCNGKTDCEDSRCTSTGFGCAEAPAGWTNVTFSSTEKPPCPSDLEPTDLKVAAGDGTPSCSCSCASVGGSCEDGNFTLVVASDPACSASPSTSQLSVNASACTALGSSIDVPSGAHARIQPPIAPTSCTAAARLDNLLTSGRVCQPPRVGGGCGTGRVCTLRTTLGLSTCVAHAGSVSCPPGFTTRNSAGTSANDTRSCSSCSCGDPTPCSGGSVSVYSSSMCKTNGSFSGAEDIVSSCNATSDSNFTATHFRATPPTGGCASAATSQPRPQGDVAFVDERTICCK